MHFPKQKHLRHGVTTSVTSYVVYCLELLQFTKIKKTTTVFRHTRNTSQIGQCLPTCTYSYRSQWPRGLRRRSAAARLLRLWVRIPPGAWMSVFCVCCELLGRVLCDELITRPEESYRLWCVVVCDLERRWSTGGLSRQKQTYAYTLAFLNVRL